MLACLFSETILHLHDIFRVLDVFFAVITYPFEYQYIRSFYELQTISVLKYIYIQHNYIRVKKLNFSHICHRLCYRNGNILFYDNSIFVYRIEQVLRYYTLIKPCLQCYTVMKLALFTFILRNNSKNRYQKRIMHSENCTFQYIDRYFRVMRLSSQKLI